MYSRSLEAVVSSANRFWLAVGTPENWHTAFDYNNIWGLKTSQQRYWDRLIENEDLVFFYATRPVSGVFGFGIVRTKLHQITPLWPQERVENRVIWPLRFEFDVVSALLPSSWKETRIVMPELKARARSGFQEVEAAVAEELIRALPPNAPQDLVLAYAIGLREKRIPLPVVREPVQVGNQHEHGQLLLTEIGRMQKLIADMEYPIENRRLDVVWRRVQRSVPSYVFEVQVSGNLTEAMGKLKQAYDLWNSKVFLVGKEEHVTPMSQLLNGTFHEIRDRLCFIELSQVEELYKRKRAYREFENQLGILP